MKPITGRQMCRLLTDAGWTLRRINGSHHIFGKAEEFKILTVPVHGSQNLKPGLAGRLAKDAHLSW